MSWKMAKVSSGHDDNNCDNFASTRRFVVVAFIVVHLIFAINIYTIYTNYAKILIQ